MKNLIIVGTGGFAIEMYEHVHNSIGYGEKFVFKGFIEGNIPCDYNKYKNLPGQVLGNCIEYNIQEDDIFVLSIADPIIKENVVKILLAKNAEFISIIHKTAVISEHAKVGNGVFCGPFTLITSNAKIGNFVMVNSYSGVGHGSIIGDFSSIMGHVEINGDTVVGHHTFWGGGSRTVPGSKIGNYAKIGAASLVLRKVKDNDTVFGVPAKSIL